ncbi:MAG: class I SAM-dependent methyltransferase [Chthoniobacterales bacterium]
MKKSSGAFQDALRFFGRFISKPQSVGSIWPSSQQLGEEMLRGVALKAGDVVIEYGPGTGPFTKLLQPYLARGVDYLGIERDDHLYKGLQQRFPEMRFHHGCAEEAPELLRHYHLNSARLIISGLPFANMAWPLQERILEATQQALRPDGYFRAFTYLFSSISPHANQFRRMAHERFLYDHGSKKVMLNFPPARVLSYSHPIVKNKKR